MRSSPKNKLTQEQFIERSNTAHKNKYDYSLAFYDGINKSVKIICPSHGIFEQNSQHHMDGHGCPSCAKNKPITIVSFIARSIILHDGIYEYDMITNIDNNKTKVPIKCPIHGYFIQTVGSHLNGRGCGKCAKNVLRSNEEFIEEAKETHGDLYDYSLTKYNTNGEKVIIICNIHGQFEQVAVSHLAGHGCGKCADELSSKNQSYSWEQTLEQINNIHNDLYDYSNVIYNNRYEPIEIKCKIHGYFWQMVAIHLRGSGCPECGKKKIGDSKRGNKEEFIEEAKNIFGDRYNYELVEYKDVDTKVKIVCPDHGVFDKTPYKHKNGQGCPTCSENSRVSKMETEWLNSLHIPKEVRNREVVINGRKFKPDAKIDNVIYEFYGDFWHGHPNFYSQKDINTFSKKTFGELYNNTLEKEDFLKNAGYTLITMWEHEWIYFSSGEHNV